MKHDKLFEIVKSDNIVIPMYIYKELPKLKIDHESLLWKNILI